MKSVLAHKASIVRMGDFANSKAAKVQQVISAKQQKCKKVQIMWEYAASPGLNRIDSVMPRAITAKRKVIFARYVRPDCHKGKEDQVAKRSQTGDEQL